MSRSIWYGSNAHMLVLLGPEFSGTSEAYERLAAASGLLPYDLRARVRSGAWGLVKALADVEQAEALAAALRSFGFVSTLVDPLVAHDPDRRIVATYAFTLREQDFVVHMPDRDMPVQYEAIACIVRGEVQPGRVIERAATSSPSSSASFRAVPAPDSLSARESQSPSAEAYQAADLHFLSVHWLARLDARSFGAVAGERSVHALDSLVDELARRSGARVDHAVRSSSVASFAPTAPRKSSAEPASVRDVRRETADPRFDAYSRLIGEAERRARTPRVELT